MLAKTIAMLDAALAKPAPKPRKKAAKKAPRKKAAKKAPRKKVAKKAPRKKVAKKAKKAPRKKVAKKAAKKAPRKKAAKKKAAKRQPSTDVVLLRVEDAAAELHGHPKPSKTRAATLRRLITGGRKALAGRDHYSRAEVADAINGAIEAGKRRRWWQAPKRSLRGERHPRGTPRQLHGPHPQARRGAGRGPQPQAQVDGAGQAALESTP